MRRKANSAIGVKFIGRQAGDVITNLEGALHTFITPVVEGWMHGDYRYLGGHGVVSFPDQDGKQQARKVIISCAIQMDFEYRSVMMAACRLGEVEVLGRGLGKEWNILDDEAKWEEERRKDYDEELRAHMVSHLVASKRLPSLQEVAGDILPFIDALRLLERHIMDPGSPSSDLQNVFARTKDGRDVISIELLYNTAVHQVQNEISILEAVCPQGYVYTSDPPSIFAQALGGATLLNRLQFAAVKNLSSTSTFSNMRAFAFNDYADREAIALLRVALREQPTVKVMPKAALFCGPYGTYKPPTELEGALLVVHNNSDAFGQNIESEWATGSLDGAVGASSSAAASLMRNREDLLDWIM
jgi:hypothetical protein